MMLHMGLQTSAYLNIIFWGEAFKIKMIMLGVSLLVFDIKYFYRQYFLGDKNR